MRRTSGAIGGVMLAVVLCGNSFALPPALRPGFVGQVTEVSGGVWVTHLGRRLPADRYQPVYVGDKIDVAGRSSATLALTRRYGGDNVPVTAGNSPYHVTGETSWINPRAWIRYLAEWSWVLQPPQNTPMALEPSQGLTASPTQFTPTGDQTIRDGAQALPIVWLGPAVTVRLSDEAGSAACTEAGPASEAQPEFTLVDCPALAPGNYHLAVGAAQDSVRFNIVVEHEAEPTGNSNDQAMVAAHTLKTRPDRRLQALADLQRLSARSYLAAAIMNRVRISP
jgi:hypothetical protein